MSFDSYRGRTFYHSLFLCFAIFLMSITKMAYAEPRMFWWVPDIYPDECTAEFANPSGHSLLAIAYPLFLYLDIFESREAIEANGERMNFKQIISLLSVFLYGILVGFSRLYLRVHSWN
jgi:membrane-associated phospholipid phosphatase